MTYKMVPGHGTCVRLMDEDTGLEFSWTGKCPILGVGSVGDNFIYLECMGNRATVVFRDSSDARWTYEEFIVGAGILACYDVRALIERAVERFKETRPAIDPEQCEHRVEYNCHALTGASEDKTRLTYRPVG